MRNSGVAAGLIAGKVGLSELSDNFVAREDLQQLMKRVDIEIGPDDDPDYPVGAKWDTVSVRLRDGTTLESKPVRRFRGHGQNPLTRLELAEKFNDCVAPKLGTDTAESLFETLQNLGNLEHVQHLPTLSL